MPHRNDKSDLRKEPSNRLPEFWDADTTSSDLRLLLSCLDLHVHPVYISNTFKDLLCSFDWSIDWKVYINLLWSIINCFLANHMPTTHNKCLLLAFTYDQIKKWTLLHFSCSSQNLCITISISMAPQSPKAFTKKLLRWLILIYCTGSNLPPFWLSHMLKCINPTQVYLGCRMLIQQICSDTTYCPNY